MKILQINNVYDFGSTGRITRDIHCTLLMEKKDSFVLYGRRYKSKDINTRKVCSELYAKIQKCLYLISGIKYGGCILSTNRIIHAIRKEKPDIVHLQCLNGHFVNIYRLICFLKKQSIPTVLTLHAEFMFTGGCGHSLECTQWRTSAGCGQTQCPLYKKELKSMMGDKSSTMWKKMKEAFTGFDNLIVVSVSPWLMRRAQESLILKDKKHIVIYNGLDDKIFHPYPLTETEKLKTHLGIDKNKKIVFHATPFFNNNPQSLKGGYYIIELSKRMQNVVFVVAGKFAHDIQVPQNIILLGNIIDKRQMALYYTMADITVLTSKRETFSMVCAESLCCGTPVVGFRAGAPEMISLPEYSDFCEYGNLIKLKESIEKWFTKKKDDSISKKAIERFNKEKMTDDYLTIYNSICSGTNYHA